MVSCVVLSNDNVSERVYWVKSLSGSGRPGNMTATVFILIEDPGLLFFDLSPEGGFYWKRGFY